MRIGQALRQARDAARPSVIGARTALVRAEALAGRYDRVIWLVGSGRSGTTWVGSLLNYRQRHREFFEPFHPRFVPQMRDLLPHQYVKPSSEDGHLYALASEVFSGRLYHRRVETGVPGAGFLFRGLLVKDIFANLFACWAARRFPGLKVVLLIRNPFAVALSKQSKGSWFWLTDPLALLGQKDLRDDYLAPHEDLIRRVARQEDYILNQVLIWGILHHVPLRQFQPDELQVVFYEDVFLDPRREIGRVVSAIDPSHRSLEAELPRDLIERPSRVSSSGSSVLGAASPLESWRDDLTPRQIDEGQEILSQLGLHGLYGERGIPDRAALMSLLEA